MNELHRIAAFTPVNNDGDPVVAGAPVDGGNPAGVWIGDDLPEAGEMLRIAAVVGDSETAFAAPRSGRRRTVRYFSPCAEVSFCGHATIALGAVLAASDGDGDYVLDTAVGAVPVAARTTDGRREISLTSVEPRQRPASAAVVAEALDILRWRQDELDPAIPPTIAYAGAWHLVLAAATRSRLARLDYDFDRARQLMEREDLTTLQLIWRENETLVHARDPFPVGGVREDPATGAAAAALGGYLRDAGFLRCPARLTIRQGEDMGRPSQLLVEAPVAGGITVSGATAELALPPAWNS